MDHICHCSLFIFVCLYVLVFFQTSLMLVLKVDCYIHTGWYFFKFLLSVFLYYYSNCLYIQITESSCFSIACIYTSCNMDLIWHARLKIQSWQYKFYSFLHILYTYINISKSCMWLVHMDRVSCTYHVCMYQ